MTIPYHPILKRFFQLHGISLMQLSLNFWATYASMHVIWHNAFGVALSVEELCFTYQLKKSLGQNGFYCIRNYGKSEISTIMVGKPSSNKGRKPEYVFLLGDFSHHHLDGAEPILVSTEFGVVRRVERPRLTLDQENMVKMVLELLEESRDCNELLTLENLMACRLIPILPEIPCLQVIDPSDQPTPSMIASDA